MCRLLLMTGLKDPTLTEKFMEAAKVPMSWGNQHGLGYSAVKKDGDFFTERWHNNDMIFNRRNVMDADTSVLLKDFKHKLPKGSLDVDYSLRGEVDFSQVSSLTMHTRFATCGREFFNTHPFVDGDFSLVHNGVITNAESLKLNKISTCDSEAALQSYINNNVGVTIENAQKWIDTLSGYWAFGIFARDASGTRILDIIRNDAGLYHSEVEGFGTVISTTEEIIRKSCNELKLMYTTPQEVKANMLFRFNATTGKLMQKVELKDSTLNKRWNQTTTKTDKNYEAITGKTTKPIRKFKERIVYGDGSYEVIFEDGSYSRYNAEYKLIEEGVRELKKPLALVPETTNDGIAHSENVSQKEEKIKEREFTNYTELFEFLDNTDEPLIDRLYEYDSMFLTNHGEQFELIPDTLRNDMWQFDSFEEVLEDISSVYEFYFGELKSEH